MTKKQKVVMPLDFRKIRQELNKTMVEFGELVGVLSQGVPYTPIPQTRINEWESSCRAVPAYVYTATAKILLDEWSCDRHEAVESRIWEVDVFYGSLLHEPLGDLFVLEHELSRSKDEEQRKMVERVRRVRLAQMRHLESNLDVKMAYVFAPIDKFDSSNLDDVVI